METCQRCGEDGQDRRTLHMSCFYQMEELGLPFEKMDFIADEGYPVQTYMLRVCKDCRAEWMEAIKKWFHEKPTINKETGTGVYIRKNGATVEATEKEVEEMRNR